MDSGNSGRNRVGWDSAHPLTSQEENGLSTPTDVEKYRDILPMLGAIETVLYIGCREQKHFVPTREKWPTCRWETLDIDPAFSPDIVWDLSRAESIPTSPRDLVICAGVLMSVPNALTALDRLLLVSSKWLVLQEAVFRPRDETLPLYRDINRFYCDQYAGSLDQAAMDSHYNRRKNLFYIGRPELIQAIYYPNPEPTVQGLWIFQGTADVPGI